MATISIYVGGNMSEVLETMKAIAKGFSLSNFDNGFVLYSDPNPNIVIYHFVGNGELEGDARIELAELTEVSKGHFHLEQGSYFLFPAEQEVILRLGRYEIVGDKKIGKVGDMKVVAHRPIRVERGVVHMAGPKVPGQKVYALIGNDSKPRERDASGYPIDTYYPDEVYDLRGEVRYH